MAFKLDLAVVCLFLIMENFSHKKRRHMGVYKIP